jgi:hypothetical protein
MSSWLGRPNLIDQKNLTFRFPNLRLDQSNSEPNLLSPFAHMALQADLGRRVAALSDGRSKNDLSAEQVFAIESECETFINNLPAIFRVADPDTALDERHPYFVFQRHQLHVVTFVTMLDYLKPYLTRDRQDKITNHDDEFRKMGVNIALRLLQVSRRLFDHEFPINAKFHMVVFSIFDTATILCSAIIHDRDNVLPQREEVMDVIDRSLEMLHQLSATTKLGASSYNFLSKLVQATPELSRHAPGSKRQRHTISAIPNIPSPTPPEVSGSTEPTPDFAGILALWRRDYSRYGRNGTNLGLGRPSARLESSKWVCIIFWIVNTGGRPTPSWVNWRIYFAIRARDKKLSDIGAWRAS